MTSNLQLSRIIVAGSILLWALFVVPTMADSTMMKVGVKQNMDAHLMTPDGSGPYPAILLLHTSGGLQSGDLDFARRLAERGYVVLVPEFLKAYGIQPWARRSTFTTYAQPIYLDLKASLDQLRNNSKVDGKRLGAIGFSNGAYFALWLAATNQVQVGVSYYGALTGAGTDKSFSRFRQVFTKNSSPMLILHGANDSTVPITNAIELDSLLTAAQSPHEFYQYAGAEHRFDRETYANDEAAATDAWQRTLAFLNKILKSQ